MTEEEFRAQLIYSPPLLFGSEDIKSAEIINTLSGTLYRWYIKDFTGSERLYGLLGEGLPHTLGLAAVIDEIYRYRVRIHRFGRRKPGIVCADTHCCVSGYAAIRSGIRSQEEQLSDCRQRGLPR